jgi:hypothetical protein
MLATACLYVGELFHITPPPRDFTPTGFNTIHKQRKSVCVKRHCNWSRTNFQTMNLHIYWELASSLNIRRRVSVSVCVCVCECVCVCVSVCVWVSVCVLHLAVTVTLNRHSVCSQNSIFTYNSIRRLQWIFISGPDLCISWTNFSLGPHTIRGLSEGASLHKLNIFVNNKMLQRL